MMKSHQAKVEEITMMSKYNSYYMSDRITTIFAKNTRHNFIFNFMCTAVGSMHVNGQWGVPTAKVEQI